LEAELQRIAAETGRPADEVVVDMVATQLDHDAWFRGEVRKGIASLDRGESLSHDEVVLRIEKLIRS
jgi:predicted transcriptional regulator